MVIEIESPKLATIEAPWGPSINDLGYVRYIIHATNKICIKIYGQIVLKDL
jgi:hypothetical protein